MTLAFDPRQHFLDIVEAADEARPEAEAGRAKGPAVGAWRVARVESRPQDFVHERLERLAALALLALQPHAHVIVQGQRCPHIAMLYI